jgi:hypothetical protein
MLTCNISNLYRVDIKINNTSNGIFKLILRIYISKRRDNSKRDWPKSPFEEIKRGRGNYTIARNMVPNRLLSVLKLIGYKWENRVDSSKERTSLATICTCEPIIYSE